MRRDGQVFILYFYSSFFLPPILKGKQTRLLQIKYNYQKASRDWRAYYFDSPLDVYRELLLLHHIGELLTFVLQIKDELKQRRKRVVVEERPKMLRFFKSASLFSFLLRENELKLILRRSLTFSAARSGEDLPFSFLSMIANESS